MYYKQEFHSLAVLLWYLTSIFKDSFMELNSAYTDNYDEYKYNYRFELHDIF